MFGKEFLCFSGERHCSESPGLLMLGHSKIKLICTIDIMSSFSRMSGCLPTHPSPLPFNCEPVLFHLTTGTRIVCQVLWATAPCNLRAPLEIWAYSDQMNTFRWIA